MKLEYTHLYKIISEMSRRRILATLKGTECSVQDLQDILSLGQSSLSAHLSQLRNGGLVDFRRKGRFVLYRLAFGNSEKIDTFLNTVLEMFSNEEWYDKDIRKLKQLMATKAELSLSFYEGVESQNKRSPGQTNHGLAIGLLRSFRGKTIIDIGCGVGRLAKEFAKQNNKVIGIDIDKKQIAIAKKSLSKNDSQENIMFVEGKGEDTGQPNSSVDIVLFSHSLHHIDEPKLAIQETHRILKKHGTIIILDLSQHEEYWMKKIYGDVWLGFREEELSEWLRETGFTDLFVDLDAGDEDFPQFESLIVTAVKK